jgi:hypothetical protein
MHTFLIPRPFWVYDLDQTNCHSCNNPFGPLRRRVSSSTNTINCFNYCVYVNVVFPLYISHYSITADSGKSLIVLVSQDEHYWLCLIECLCAAVISSAMTAPIGVFHYRSWGTELDQFVYVISAWKLLI